MWAREGCGPTPRGCAVAAKKLGLGLMGTVVSGSRAIDAGLLARPVEPHRRGHAPRHAAPPTPGDRGSEAPRGALSRAVDLVRRYLPRGNTLDDNIFQRRHLFLCWVLGLHIPALIAFGLWNGFPISHLLIEMTVPAACVVFARVARNRRLGAFYVTAGLVFCSTVVVHLSGGSIEAHFHFFILIGLIALYQDWIPFLWNVIFTVFSHGLGTVFGGSIMFAHTAGQNRPWTWAVIHGVAVLAACVGEIIFWKHTEQEQERNVQLVADLAAADAQRREAMSELLVNLARRNQSLLNRQLEVITDLEVREREPEVLEELFRLDHLATRIRRNAESLLVLSGDDPARRWGRPVPLADVVRAAGAEVEDYRRVEVLVNDHIEVVGRAVADLAHLLAELIENATTFSPPTSNVRVRSHLSSGETVSTVVSIEDSGIGMPDDELRNANTLLAEAPEVDLGRSTMLGFHVVARLAHRYGIEVRLAPTPGGGVTAMVTLPADLVSERPAGAVATDAASRNGVDRYGVDRYQQAAVLARSNGTHRRALLEAPRAEAVPPRSPVDERPVPSADTPRPRASELVSPWREIEVPARSVEPQVAQEEVDPFSAVVAKWRQSQVDEARAEQTAAPAVPPIPPAPVVDDPGAALAALPPAPLAEAAPLEPPDWWWESEAFVRGDGSAPGSPRPLAPAGPSPAEATRRTAPSPTVATPAATPTPVAPASAPAPRVPTLASGLVQRVPGAHLAPSLRRDGPETSAPARDVPAPRSAEQVRSALSSFQSSQRAGRAAADAEADAGPPPVEGR